MFLNRLSKQQSTYIFICDYHPMMLNFPNVFRKTNIEKID